MLPCWGLLRPPSPYCQACDICGPLLKPPDRGNNPPAAPTAPGLFCCSVSAPSGLSGRHAGTTPVARPAGGSAVGRRRTGHRRYAPAAAATPAATVAAPALSSALPSGLLLADEAARRVLQAVQKTAASLTASADSKAPWWVLRGCACSRCRVRIANTAATQGRTAGGTGASSD